jgi:hypothetical protein
MIFEVASLILMRRREILLPPRLEVWVSRRSSNMVRYFSTFLKVWRVRQL